MGQRLQLHSLLTEILGSDRAYFQPPPSVQIVYPCIVYGLDSAETDFADNGPYRYEKRYQVTVIDRNPDSVIPDKVAMLPMCALNRTYGSDGLNHYVFNLYY